MSFSSSNGTVTLKTAISKDTQDTLNLVTDPYHDFNLQTKGFPDGKSVQSAVQRHYGRIGIKCPFTLAPGDTWSFNVVSTGLHAKDVFRKGAYNTATGKITYGTDTALLGPVIVMYRHQPVTGSPQPMVIEPLGPGDNVADGTLDKSRIVSLGFELHNTTAEIYRCGDLTVYRADMAGGDYFGSTTLDASTTFYSAKIACIVPLDVSVASAMANTRTWEAHKGAYCVSLPPASNDYCSPMTPNIIMVFNSYTPATGITADLFGIKATSIESNTYRAGYTPLYNSGIISGNFTDTNQTFTLDYRMVVETCPSASSTLISFSSPSAPVDRVFLKMYKQMIPLIPPAVPVGFNDAGEWFRRILRIANTVLPLVAPLLPGPGKLIASAAVPALQVVEQVVNKRQANKQITTRNKQGRMLPAKRQ